MLAGFRDNLLLRSGKPSGKRGFAGRLFPEKTHTSDVLYKIDISNDEVSLVSLPGNAGLIDAKNPSVNAGNLYFINLYDNSLYSLTIR